MELVNSSGFHLPHNAIKPEEFFFIAEILDENKEYYIYDDFKALIFEEMVKKGKFEEFHSRMYENILKNAELRLVYENIERGEMFYDDIKNLSYTTRKSFNQLWNEQARDYSELLAFTGMLPAYYKGTNNLYNDEKKHYIGETLIQWKNSGISDQNVLLKMKFKNASKNEKVYREYNVRNRPFVVALRVLDIYKSMNYRYVSGHHVSYLVRNTLDEDNVDDLICRIRKLGNPTEKLPFARNINREIARGTTFFKQYLNRVFKVELSKKHGKKTVFDLKNFDYSSYNIKEKALFINDMKNTIEITPDLVRALEHPEDLQDEHTRSELERAGYILGNSTLIDFNVDTDLQDRALIEQLRSKDPIKSEKVLIKKEDFRSEESYSQGYKISKGSDGTKYEEFLYGMLKGKFGEENVVFLGSNTLGQRLSDIFYITEVINQKGNISRILNIVEAKAGKAIKSLDERKEIDNLLNVLVYVEKQGIKYDGVWVHFINGDSLTRNDTTHGGYRGGQYSKSFEEKLLLIHSAMLNQVWRPILVTAFSYDKHYQFIEEIDFVNQGFITEISAPNYWVWSREFLHLNYVSIHV